MLTRVALVCRHAAVLHQCTRQLGVSAACYQKAATATDPIQKLFLDKVREYDQKSKASGGKMVDVSAEQEKALTEELSKLSRVYGASGPDFLKFPTFNFEDPTIQPVGVDPTVSEAKEDAAAAEEGREEEEKAFWEV